MYIASFTSYDIKYLPGEMVQSSSVATMEQYWGCQTMSAALMVARYVGYHCHKSRKCYIIKKKNKLLLVKFLEFCSFDVDNQHIWTSKVLLTQFGNPTNNSLESLEYSRTPPVCSPIALKCNRVKNILLSLI